MSHLAEPVSDAPHRLAGTLQEHLDHAAAGCSSVACVDSALHAADRRLRRVAATERRRRLPLDSDEFVSAVGEAALKVFGEISRSGRRIDEEGFERALRAKARQVLVVRLRDRYGRASSGVRDASDGDTRTLLDDDLDVAADPIAEVEGRLFVNGFVAEVIAACLREDHAGSAQVVYGLGPVARAYFRVDGGDFFGEGHRTQREVAAVVGCGAALAARKISRIKEIAAGIHARADLDFAA